MKKAGYLCAAALLAATVGIVPAHALEYTIDAPRGHDYYSSTNYDEAYGSGYVYGGMNLSDFERPVLPGLHSAVEVQQPLISTGTAAPDLTVSPPPVVWDSSWIADVPATLFTDADTLVRSDGSIGTLKIPTLGISYKAYEGETSSSMNKGVGHFSSTSGWDGNIGLCGHNRGSSHNIGSIKNLSIGDRITYTTVLGKRTYYVSFVGKIASDDWSYLEATSDNCITLITCSANEPEYRWCVQAEEGS